MCRCRSSRPTSTTPCSAATTCGTAISYYFRAQTTAGAVVYNPIDAPATAYHQKLAGYGQTVPFEDDHGNDQGWTVGDIGDTAITGIWTRNVPQATPAQPGDDHTPAPGTHVLGHGLPRRRQRRRLRRRRRQDDRQDADLRPVRLHASHHQLLALVLQRRRPHPNADTFRVDISNNGGNTWINAETVGPSGPEASGGWYYHAFYVGSFVPLTSQIRLRFVAEDAGSGSIIEAAVDDFRIETVDCNLARFDLGDLNCDHAVDFGDINPFVLTLTDPAGYAALYPDCDINLADINGDGSVDFGDINPFVDLLTGL